LIPTGWTGLLDRVLEVDNSPWMPTTPALRRL